MFNEYSSVVDDVEVVVVVVAVVVLAKVIGGTRGELTARCGVLVCSFVVVEDVVVIG